MLLGKNIDDNFFLVKNNVISIFLCLNKWVFGFEVEDWDCY